MSEFLTPIDEDAPELMPRGNGGGQLMPTETKIGDVVSMRRAAVLMPRQPAEVRRQIAEMAEMFGDGFEYRFPVKSRRTGQTEFIEGPTIGCTMAVARAYGNCDVAHTRTEDEGNSWVLYSTFVDLQSGFSLTRGFRQRKGQSTMGSDRERGEDIAFQIGVSKSTRNVVARALDDFVQYARQRARERLSGQIGKRPDEYRERIRSYLAEADYPLSAVEGAIGAKISAWSNEQIASVVRTLTAHKDRILTDLDEVYRPRAASAEATPQSDPPQPRQEARPAPASEPRTETAAEAASPSGGQREPVGARSGLRQFQLPQAAEPKPQASQDKSEFDEAWNRGVGLPPVAPKRRQGRPSRAEVEARQKAQNLLAQEIIDALNTVDPGDVDGMMQHYQEDIANLPDELRTEVVAAAQYRMASADAGENDYRDPLDAEGKPPIGEFDPETGEVDPEPDPFTAWRTSMEELVGNIPRDLRAARKKHWLADAAAAGWGERGAQAVEEAFKQ